MSKLFDRINPKNFSELLDEFNPRREGQICNCCGEFFFLDEDPVIEKEGICEDCLKGLEEIK